MNKTFLPTLITFFTFLNIFSANFLVTSQDEFDTALNSAVAGDIIEWANGTYSDIYMEIDADGITVKAQNSGDVIFNGNSRTRIRSNNVTFTGFQYIGGNILVEGSTDTIAQTIITIDGSNTNVSQLNFSAYTCWKYMRIRDSSQYTNVSYSNFENRLNYANQNIFQIDVSADQPGFHNVSYCSFKDFTGDPVNATNGDDGVEPIRIGSSSQSTRSSRSVIEYCHFTSCNGDDEVISGKATDCIYRYNTLEGNNGEIVLRYGDRGIVYSNFFVNNEAGVRVREGSDHIIYNNYFSGLTDRSIQLQASDDRLENIIIANNTFVNTKNLDLGDSDATNDPLNTVFINNLFQNTTSSNFFRDEAGTEIWFGNIMDTEDDLGLAVTPNTGISFENPGLTVNNEGFYQLPESSIAVDAAVDNAAIFPFPLIEGLTYDNTIAFDLLSNTRDAAKDVGAQEYNATAQLIPYVNEGNTGPAYLTGLIVSELSASTLTPFIFNGTTKTLTIESNVEWTASTDSDWVSLSTTSGSNNGSIQVTAAANTVEEERSALITITGGELSTTVTVTQAAFELVPDATYIVTTQAEFEAANSDAVDGDIIEWANGIYSDIFMDVDANNITVRAETPGGVIFNGTSRAIIDGSNVTFTGFQYIGGNILVEGSTDTILQTILTIGGSNNNVNQLNFSAYTCWKYMRIRNSSQHTNVSYVNFENRLNYADQNIFQIDVSADQPGFHNVSYCSFKDFTGDPVNATNGDDGVEPIRIGSSSQSTRSSRSVIEYCHFTSCNGDDEVISGKATDCVYRYNTLEGNNGEIVLRHGDRGIVYSNFFVNNEAGVRVREGSDHIIYNNYFSGLTDRSIQLQASDDRLENVIIANNTFVNTHNLDLGDSDATNDPLNTVLINNLFQNTTSSNFFRDEAGTEIWFGNIMDTEDDLGLTATPDTGISFENPGLTINNDGFYQLPESSIAVDAAVDNTAVFPFPLIEGLTYDNTIAFDLLSNTRDAAKDVGAQEYNATAQVIPYVNEDNTGPAYLTGVPASELSASNLADFSFESTTETLTIESNIDWIASTDSDWISLSTTNGVNNGTVDVTVLENTDFEQRSATITITGGGLTVTVDVVQEAANQISASELSSFLAAGGENTLTITSNIDWTASADSDWISLSPTNGTNDGSITVTALENLTTETRTAIITISGEDLTINVEVTQDALELSSCEAGTNLALNGTIIDFSGQHNDNDNVHNILDGNDKSKWLAFGFPQYAVIDLGAVYEVSAINLLPLANRAYQFTVEGSVNNLSGDSYTLVDATSNTSGGSQISESFNSTPVRYVRLTISGASGYNGELSSILDFEILCAGEFSTYVKIPAKIEAEDYVSQNGVLTEDSRDVDNGTSVGYIDTGDYMTYLIDVPTTGTYTFDARVASRNTATSFAIFQNENTVGNVNIPATGGWYNWETVTTTVNLTEGKQTLRIVSTKGGWNINWFEIQDGLASSSCTEGTNLALNAQIIDFSDDQGNNTANNIIDGNPNTRWSARGLHQFVVIDLNDVYNVNGIELSTYEDRDYQFLVEGSKNSPDSGFTALVDATSNTETSPINLSFDTQSQSVRYIKLTIIGAYTYNGPWSAITNFEIYCAGNSAKKISETGTTVSVYPNPVELDLTISNAANSNVLIYDITGKLLLETSLDNNNETTVDLSSLASGVYYAQIKGGDYIEVKKIIKK